MKNIIHIISGIISFASFLYCLGLAGLSDCNDITWNALWPRLTITMLVLITSFIVWYNTDTGAWYYKHSKKHNRKYHY